MRVLAFTVATLLTLADASLAQENEVTETITNQFDAFQGQDFEAAFELASPIIQQRMSSPSRFEEMLKNSFPMMLRAPGLTFLEQQKRPPFTWQIVQVTDPSGAKYFFAYEMIQIDSEWRINGVYPLSEPDPSV